MKKEVAFYKNTWLKIFSVVLAFAAWLIVVEKIDKEAYDTLKNIPINMQTVEESIGTLGLNSITPDVETASVNISGIMYAVGNMKAEDIEIVPDISKVTGAGVYELPLVGKIKNDDGQVQIQSISPSRITVKFDTLYTKTLNITKNINGLKGDIGYLIQEEMVTPSQVAITGPEAEVSRVARCEIQLNVDEKLSQTYSKKAGLTLLDKDGNVLEVGNISMDIEEATVTIPVLKVKEVPVKLQFMNVPENFPVNQLQFTISNETIQVAGTEAAIDKYAEIPLDYIDIRSLGLESTFAFNIKLPAGFWNVENIQNVQVQLDSSGMVSKRFNIDQINIINVPLGYQAQAITQQITNVEIIGPQEIVESLLAGDIIAEIDLKESSDVVTGQVVLPVKIYAPNSGLVWARGTYEAVVSIAEEQPADLS